MRIIKLQNGETRTKPELPEVRVAVPSYSSRKKRVEKDMPSRKKRIKTQTKVFASATSQHLRNARNINEFAMGWNQCNNFTFMIKYEDHYKVWNNFTIIYQGKTYVYNEYRLTDDGLQICDSPDRLISEKWRNLTAWEKKAMAFKHCLASVDGFYHENYTLYKNFTVFFKPTGQHFRKQDYGVISEYFAICSTKISLTCNNYFQINNTDQYIVFDNFSFFYHNKIYDYREYRLRNESIEICASSHRRILDIWRTRNSWEKFRLFYSCLNHYTLKKPYYTVNKQFVVYYAARSQYFTRNDYAVNDGNPFICSESLRYKSAEYTKKDLLMCNDSIINIKYNDEYKVWNDLSIIYKNKTYHYTEYRILNDSIKICNSTDHFVNNIWKVRNYWVMEKRGSKDCNRRWKLYKPYYIFNKQFTIYVGPRSQYIPRYEYAVKNGEPFVCYQNLRPKSTEYTKEDLLICNQSIVNIKYNDEYKVFSNYSILFSNKIYDYTEYRVLDDSIKICNSTDNFIKGIWKLRNYWIIRTRTSKICDKKWKTYKRYYTLNKKFTAYVAPHTQYFTRNEYDVINGRLRVCKKKLRPITTEYTKEDLLMCNDSIIYVKYDEDYKVWNNLSILYKNKMYSYTEYGVLNGSIKICNSTNNFVKNVWKERTKWIRKQMACRPRYKLNGQYQNNLTYFVVTKQFAIFTIHNGQYFTPKEYAVVNGEVYVCKENFRNISYLYTSEDLRMCNVSIINIKYDNEYKVLNNFSIIYKNKMYNYTEYRALKDGIKICNSTNELVKRTWIQRNYWVMLRRHSVLSSSAEDRQSVVIPLYRVDWMFNIYVANRNQYFSMHDYGVINGQPVVRVVNLKPESKELTEEDLFMCRDSIVNISINNDDEYKVWNNFSILYKNKMYNSDKYQILNDSIRICNSTGMFKISGKPTNDWETKHSKNCSKLLHLDKSYYIVNKQLIVYSAARNQYFTRNDYTVSGHNLLICKAKARPISYEYTQEDLLMCSDSIINIQYDDQYKVWKNFSMLYQNKTYHYTEYRILNESIKICNSTDHFVKNIWKLRNYWVMERRHTKSCNEILLLNKPFYIVNNQFTIYYAVNSQYFPSHSYAIKNGEPVVCKRNVQNLSTEYTKEDLLMCNSSTIKIKYDDDYNVWNNFSIIYKKKVYSYTEYRDLNNAIKICNSTYTFVKEIWRLRNHFVKATMHTKNCNKPIRHIPLYQREYNVLNDFKLIVSKDLFLSKNYYGIFKGNPIICVTECANSTFTIKYKDEYRLWNNFSMSYKDQIYHYFDYRVTDDSVQVCNSSARPIIEKWRNLVALEKRTTAYQRCSVSVDGFYHENYTVYKDFVVFFKPTRQNFSRLNYGVIAGYFVICSSKLQFSCNDRLVKIQYNEQYEVFKNFSLFYNNNIYDYREYRFSRKTLDMCDSKDSRVMEIWRTRNKWEKSLSARCFHPYKLNTRQYTVNKEFTLYSTDDGQSFKRYDYAVIDASPYVCNKKTMPNFIITDMRIVIMPLCALALSFVCLLLLLIVYFLLPELRTLPGLNLMSASFSFLLWQIYLIVFLSLYSSLGNLVTKPCDRLFVINKFITYSILMNAVVSIYHLRKTFCGNTLVKSDVNKWKGFLKYSLFSWGVPVVIAIVYIVLVKTDTLTFDLQISYMKGNFESSLRFYQRIELINEDAVEDKLIFYQHNVSMKVDVPTNIRIHKRILLKNEDYNDRMYHHITGDCMNVRITPSWAAAVDVYGIQGCLMTYITIMFILTACEIRRKLKAGSRLTQKTNDRKFVLFLKLSTTTALSYWFPLFISEMIDFSFDIKIALYTITLLSGAYIGIAFGFTRRNYQLLKKKYFPETNQRITRTN